MVCFAFGSPNGVSQLASKVHKHSFMTFFFSDDWVASADVSNMAYFAAAVASFVSVGTVFPVVVGFIFSTASTRFARHVCILSTDEFF